MAAMIHTPPAAGDRRVGANECFDHVVPDASFRRLFHTIATPIAGAVAPAPEYVIRNWDCDLLAVSLSKWAPFVGQEEDDPRHNHFLGSTHITAAARYDAVRVAIAAGFNPPANGVPVDVIRAALDWARANVASLRGLTNADLELGPAAAHPNHYRNRVPLTAFFRSVKDENLLNGWIDALIVVGPVHSAATRAPNTRFSHSLEYIKETAGIPDGPFVPVRIAEWISASVLHVSLTLFPQRINGIPSWFTARVGYRSSVEQERRDSFTALFPLIATVTTVAPVMRFLTPAPLEQDQILNFGKMAAALFPAITIPWSLDVMEQVAGRVSDTSDGFMFICNEEDAAAPVGDSQRRVTRLCELVARTEAQRAATGRGAGATALGDGAAEADRTTVSGLQQLVKLDMVRQIEARVVALSAAPVANPPQIFFEIFSGRFCALSSILVGRVTRTAPTAKICEVAESVAPSLAEYLSFMLFRDTNGVRPEHTFKWTFPDKVLNMFRCNQKDKFLELGLLPLAAAVRSVKERVPCCPQMDSHSAPGECLRDPLTWFTEEAHLSMLLYLVPMWEALGCRENSVLDQYTWRFAVDALTVFWRKGSSFVGEMRADHLKNVRLVFRAIQEDLFRFFSTFTRVVFPDPLERVPEFVLQGDRYTATLNDLAQPISTVFQMGAAFPALRAFLSGAPGASSPTKRPNPGGDEDEGRPPKAGKGKSGIGSARGTCTVTKSEVRFGQAVYDKVAILSKLDRNEGNCCIASYLSTKTGKKRFSACQHAKSKNHLDFETGAHKFTVPMDEMRPMFEHKPYRKDKGAKSAATKLADDGKELEVE